MIPSLLISICLLNRREGREKSSMEFELGLKITRTRDDFTSEIRIAKDRAGPLFQCSETETKFVLTAHLKGFNRERIKIAINEDGTQIAISGEKPIQELVMEKWIMYKKEAEVKVFCKVFWIPDNIILDRIKAKFNEEDSILRIVMPKKIRGIRGIEIEEVKQEELQSETEEEPDEGGFEESEGEEKEESPKAEPKKSISDRSTQTEGEPDESGLAESEEADKEESPKAELEKSFIDRSTQTEGEPDETGLVESEEADKEESPKAELEKSFIDRSTQTQGEADETGLVESEEADKEESPRAELKKSLTDRSTQTEKWPSRKLPLCPSLFAGSAFLVSLIVLVIQLLRNQERR